ncbi:MAG: isoprenylcysteine carboxyl methyltransferase (ICMT) family protein YpbQ [Paracoccaceae bacterium]|jgi:isoprenylcysteine carboxyl methyltransferase (ICMT) family protein YpbQ
MKLAFRKMFSLILNYFESSEGEFKYRKSHRTILVVVGGLFLVLSSISALAAVSESQFGTFIPIVVFFTVGFVCIVVGSLGNERAVATIWGSK